MIHLQSCYSCHLAVMINHGTDDVIMGLLSWSEAALAQALILYSDTIGYTSLASKDKNTELFYELLHYLKMVCVDIGVEYCKHPTWSRVGMEITPDELRKVVESKEYDTSFLDMALHDFGCMILALSMAFLVISMIYLWISRKKSPGQGKGGFLQCKGNMQKLHQGFELQEQVLLKMDGMEQRMVSLEGFLRSMWRRSKGDGKLEAADKYRDASGFSDGSN